MPFNLFSFGRRRDDKHHNHGRDDDDSQYGSPIEEKPKKEKKKKEKKSKDLPMFIPLERTSSNLVRDGHEVLDYVHGLLYQHGPALGSDAGYFGNRMEECVLSILS